MKKHQICLRCKGIGKIKCYMFGKYSSASGIPKLLHESSYYGISEILWEDWVEFVFSHGKKPDLVDRTCPECLGEGIIIEKEGEDEV